MLFCKLFDVKGRLLVVRACCLAWCLVKGIAMRKSIVRNFGLVVRAALVVVALFGLVALSGCGILNNAAKLQEYSFDDDKLPSLNSVVGERTVTGVNTAIKNGVNSKSYSYKSDSGFDDAYSYYTELAASGWTLIEDWDGDPTAGVIIMGAESLDAGKILTISISYDASSLTVEVKKFTGTMTYY
jgi:hypothetical protein